METEPRPRRSRRVAFIIGCLAALILAVLHFVPSLLRAEAAEEATPASVERRAQAVRKKLGDSYAVVASFPYIVAGNLPEDDLRRFLRQTVIAADEALHKEFLSERPRAVIMIYLFRDDQTYRRGAKELFGDEPSTPYGYFKPESLTLVMNIATGGGTLVHELTHALVAPDFPDIPDWFNEGFASLFEQCTIRDGRIRGLKNWRLPGLLKAMKTEGKVSLRRVIEKKSGAFYTDDDRGINYAVARYFCMYLQETDRLPAFYKAFRADVKDDPTGNKAIEKVCGKPISAVEAEFMAWVRGLSGSGGAER